MNKKYIAGGILFVLAALSFLWGAWFYSQYKKSADVRGRYAFSRTREKINYLGSIQIYTKAGGKISLFRLSDGSWRFKEAKEYYVNEDRLSDFFRMVKNSIVVSAVEADDTFLQKNNLTADSGISIKTYDYDGNLLDDIIIGNQDEQNNMMWINKAENVGFAYMVSSNGKLSGEAPDWLPYPLLTIKTSDIKSVTINGKKTDFVQLKKNLRHSAIWRDFARVLEFVEYFGLTFKSDLADLSEDVKIRNIDVGMMNGMIYKLTILNVEDSYWLIISMDANKVFTTEAIDIATDTYRYYADWIFHLSDEQGKVLFSEALTD